MFAYPQLMVFLFPPRCIRRRNHPNTVKFTPALFSPRPRFPTAFYNVKWNEYVLSHAKTTLWHTRTKTKKNAIAFFFCDRCLQLWKKESGCHCEWCWWLVGAFVSTLIDVWLMVVWLIVVWLIVVWSSGRTDRHHVWDLMRAKWPTPWLRGTIDIQEGVRHHRHPKYCAAL